MWEKLATPLLVICALVTTGLVIHRELAVTSGKSGAAKPVYIDDWKSQIVNGTQFGPPHAPVQIIEFADFECPFCGTFSKVIKALREHYPDQVALTFVHYPLPGHRFAAVAARVAECAGEQGRFESMYERLFDSQQSFGLKPWGDYAVEAGVPDLAQFDLCVKQQETLPRIEAGKALALRLNVKGTPTVVVNGWELAQPPSEAQLDSMVRQVLAGKSPVG